jgi:NAD(P)-dependent dehydrogenase (short-subunit alcohol dehydrogenase family)
MSLPITAKIVLVTGANQGLGFEIAKSLSSKPGYHVLMGSRDTQRGIKAASMLQEQGLVVEALTIELVLSCSLSPFLASLYTRGFFDISEMSSTLFKVIEVWK